jgi:hypothetical protein
VSDEITLWQESPQGMVAGQVTLLSAVVSELSQSSKHGERSLYLNAERADIELAHRELGRVLARIPNMQSEAA